MSKKRVLRLLEAYPGYSFPISALSLLLNAGKGRIYLDCKELEEEGKISSVMGDRPKVRDSRGRRYQMEFLKKIG